MAIRIIEGVPGAGKTLYAVHHLLKTYYLRDQDGFYKPKTFMSEDGQPQTLRIITNIENLKVKHEILVDEIHKAGGYNVFFSNDYQEKHFANPLERVVYIIDEAQNIFRKKVKGDWEDVYFYFEYHRHYGHDIYLLTQNVKKVNPEISDMREYLIHSKPRVRSLTGEFSYQMISDGDVLKREAIKPSPELFNMYKSRRQAESETIRNPMIIKTIGMFALSLCIIGGGLWYVKSKFQPHSGEAVASEVSTTDNVSKSGKNDNTNQKAKPINEEVIKTKTIAVSVINQTEKGKRDRRFFVIGSRIIADWQNSYKVKRVWNQFYLEIPETDIDLFDLEKPNEKTAARQGDQDWSDLSVNPDHPAG